MDKSISAYIPTYNNEATLSQAIHSLQQQTIQPAELFIIDDSSTDSSASIAKAANVEVLSNTKNQGRGAMRAQAMLKAKHELVLACDAGVVLAPDFIEKSLHYFEENKNNPNKMAGLQGRIIPATAKNTAERWRNRHLFMVDRPAIPTRKSSIANGATILSKSIVLDLGNYDSSFRFAEDKDLGKRILAAGYEIIFDPRIEATAITRNNVWQSLERYTRWHTVPGYKIDFASYLKLISYSIKVLAWQDLEANDPLAALISLACPHFQFWYSHFY